MATVQQFDFLVRASTDIAIQKLNALGAAALKTSGDIERIEDIDFAAWGQSALNGATRAAGGMLSLATAASNVVEQANFVDQVFKDAAPGIKAWAETADRTALLSEQAALKSAAYLGVFGQAIGLTGQPLATFSTNLVDLAADLASVANTSVDTAVTAVGAAMRNEYEPMRKYGIVLNEGMLKQALFDATGQNISGTMTQQQKIIAVNQALFQQLGFAIGDVDRTFGGMANQSRYLDAQMENLKAQVGEGLRPAFIGLFEMANSAVGALRGMPPVAAEIGGKLALTATAITGVVGAMTVVWANAPKYVQAFNDMRLAMTKMNESTKFTTQAMAGFAKGATFIGAVALAADVAFSAINNANDMTGKFAKSLQDISKGNVTGDIESSYEAFLKLADAQDKNLQFSHLWEDFGQDIKLFGDDSKHSIEDVDAAFKKMLQQDPAAAANVLDYMKQQTETLDHNSEQYRLNQERIAKWTGQVEQSVTAAQLQGETTKFTQEQMKIYGDEALNSKASNEEAEKAAKEATKAFEEQMKVLQENADKWNEYASKLSETEAEFGDLEARVEALGDALGEAMGTNQAEENMLDIRNAAFDMVEAFRDDDGNIDGMLMSMSQFDQVGRDNIAAAEDLAEAVGEELMRAYQDSGGSMTDMMRKQSELRDEFMFTATAAGVPTEKVQELADTIFATPEEIAIAVILSGQEEAKAKIDSLGLEISDIPTEYKTQYMALIDSGDFVGAWKLGQQIIDEQGDLAATLIAEAAPIGPKLSEVQRDVNGKPIKVPLEPDPKPTKPATQEMQRNTEDLETDVNPQAKSTSMVTSTMQSWTADLTTDVNPVAKPTSMVTATMQGWTADLTTAVNAHATDPMPARNSMQWTVGGNPLGVDTNAKPGDTAHARNDMQWTMNNNPLSIAVNPRLVITNAWNSAINNIRNSIPGASGTSAGAAAPTSSASAGAMTMGVVVPPPVASGRVGPSATPSIINLNISMPLPVGADETRVVAALKRYTKNNGALPIQIAS